MTYSCSMIGSTPDLVGIVRSSFVEGGFQLDGYCASIIFRYRSKILIIQFVRGLWL